MGALAYLWLPASAELESEVEADYSSSHFSGERQVSRRRRRS